MAKSINLLLFRQSAQSEPQDHPLNSPLRSLYRNAKQPPVKDPTSLEAQEFGTLWQTHYTSPRTHFLHSNLSSWITSTQPLKTPLILMIRALLKTMCTKCNRVRKLNSPIYLLLLTITMPLCTFFLFPFIYRFTFFILRVRSNWPTLLRWPWRRFNSVIYYILL